MHTEHDAAKKKEEEEKHTHTHTLRCAYAPDAILAAQTATNVGWQERTLAAHKRAAARRAASRRLSTHKFENSRWCRQNKQTPQRATRAHTNIQRHIHTHIRTSHAPCTPESSVQTCGGKQQMMFAAPGLSAKQKHKPNCSFGDESERKQRATHHKPD